MTTMLFYLWGCDDQREIPREDPLQINPHVNQRYGGKTLSFIFYLRWKCHSLFWLFCVLFGSSHFVFQVTGLDGNYRITCHTVMEVLREHRDSVMAVLEAFVYDPLLNWRLMDSKNICPPKLFIYLFMFYCSSIDILNELIVQRWT